MAKRKIMKNKREKEQRKNPEQDMLRWDFSSTNHGEEDGFADPLLEYFQGDHEKFVARETIQNAVDARLDYEKPVQVVFERFEVPISSIPECRMLMDRMKRCIKFVTGQGKTERFFRFAISLLKGDKLPVLKISDFNTVGLSGSDDDRSGNWYRLVRIKGTSSPKGVAGGSFGIGKGAPIAASALRTVFYSSINDRGDAVFQGKARLMSHYNEEKDVRHGVGFYGIDGYRAVRDRNLIPDFFSRKDRGTDIFIMGYKSDSDWQPKLIRSVLHNFWLAILSGDLEVVVKDGGDKIISKDTLSKCLEEYDAEDAKFFFESVTNWTQRFEQELKYLGKTVLFVRKQDGYPSKIMMARKPKMLVQEKQYRVLREPYAGVLVCGEDRGNQLLGDLEPPSHDRWDKDRAPDGFAALRELDDFIKQSLKSMGEAITSEPQDIPGLDRYLPDSEDRDYIPQQGTGPIDPTEMFSQEETGREIGALKESSLAEIEKIIRKGIVTNKQTGKVKPMHPEGLGEGPHGRPTGLESGDKEGIRIKTSSISFRSFVQKANSSIEYHFIITGKEDCEGAIRLVAVGDDGNYPADLKSAVDTSSGKHYEIADSMIRGLSIKNGETTRIVVLLASKKKYALGIENYEG